MKLPVEYLLAVALLSIALGFSYVTGRKHEREAWNDKMAKASIAAAKETQRLVEKNYAISVVATQVLQRERVVTRTLLDRVYVEIPTGACPIASAFRVLHDAAARGEDPGTGPATDGAPVPVKDAAATVVTNYGACRQDQERLKLLQEWVASIAGKEVLCPIQ